VYGADEVTTGASGDLQQVRNIARRMVTEWGFSKDKLAPVSWEAPGGGNQFGQKGASEATERRIDHEVKELVAKAYVTCKETLTSHRELLDELTDALIEKETIDYTELYQMVGQYEPEIAARQAANFPADLKQAAADAAK